MQKKYKFIIGFLVVLLAGLVYLEASQPQPINWSPSYSRIDKIPLGTFVFFESLQQVSPNLEEVNIPPYEFLQDTTKNGTYFFINNNLFFDTTEFDKLLAWVAKGNTLFLAGNNFNNVLLDTLKLSQKSTYSLEQLETFPKFNYTNPRIKSDSAYRYERNNELVFFNKIDTLKHTILGTASIKNDSTNLEKPRANFVEAPHGDGKLYLHSNPESLSNYFMLLKNNYTYAEKLLSYINTQGNVYWDNYYKSGKTITTSPLYLLFKNKYLKWAYYFVLIGTLLFVIFEGKRKQKSIKIIPPVKNQTYDYTRTIAGMYLDKKDHKAIAEKQIEQLLSFIRTQLRVEIQQLSKETYTLLAEQTGNSKEEIEALFTTLQNIQQKTQISKEELVELNQHITHFKKQF